MIQLTDNVFYFEQQPEIDRPNIVYIWGEDMSFLVDAGTSKSHADFVKASIKKDGMPLPDFVAITHSHWDHSFALPYYDAMTIAGDRTAAILKEMSSWSWTEEEFEKHIASNELPLFCKPHILIEYPDLSDIEIKVPDVEISEETVFDLGDVHIRAIPVPSPHTDDSVVYYVEEDKVLLTGDAHCKAVYGEDWIDRPELRKQFIDKLKTIDFEICITGHDEPMTREEFFKEFS